MKREYLKTHNYKILKTYTVEEIKAHGDAEFFYDKEVTDKRIKLRRAHILNEIGHNCSEEGCNISGFHYALGEDKGGGLHLDLYAYDKEGDLVMITIDHIKPKSKGGSDDIENLRPHCKPHNEMKANDYNFNREFKNLLEIYPKEPMFSKNYEIRREVLSQQELDIFSNMGGFLANKYASHFEVGKEYVQLIKRDSGTMMSDHPSETMSNQEFINKAYGDVMIFGLGLGMIIFPLLDDDVKSITVVEQDLGVIDMVGPIIKKYDTKNKVTIINGDAFKYHEVMPNSQRFDTIYFDIWIRIDDDAFNQMEELHNLYRKFLRSNICIIDSWCYSMKQDYLESI
jgi:5-methylcytosine-specific restriction endonuclease McrA